MGSYATKLKAEACLPWPPLSSRLRLLSTTFLNHLSVPPPPRVRLVPALALCECGSSKTKKKVSTFDDCHLPHLLFAAQLPCHQVRKLEIETTANLCLPTLSDIFIPTYLPTYRQVDLSCCFGRSQDASVKYLLLPTLGECAPLESSFTTAAGIGLRVCVRAAVCLCLSCFFMVWNQVADLKIKKENVECGGVNGRVEEVVSNKYPCAVGGCPYWGRFD